MNREAVLEKLKEVRQRLYDEFGVANLLVFGSVARDSANGRSDLDVLVEFEQEATFDGFMELKFFLEDLTGVRVDLVTRQALRPEMKERVEREGIHVA